MNKIKYMAMALAALLFASCMGNGYDEPDLSTSPWGNNEIQETNVLTIAQLKEKYKSTINNAKYTLISEDIQIKGIVTGNDIGGNLYNEVSLQDETGALLVCINASGLYGYLPVGQEILVNLNGVYVGGYGKQAEIGGVYTNTKTGAQSIGKMDRYLWQTKFKAIGTVDKTKAEAMRKDFNPDSYDIEADAAKLMTIKNVKFQDANGTAVFAPEDGSVTLTANCANRGLINAATGRNIPTSKVVVRTSSYSKFANAVLPSEAVNITGIFTRYNNVWQILIRDTNDIEAAQ